MPSYKYMSEYQKMKKRKARIEDLTKRQVGHINKYFSSNKQVVVTTN